MQHEDIPNFHNPTIVSESGLNLPVYVSEDGSRPLIILHEMPGMTPSFLRYCRRMAAEGFKVYMPLLFKEPGTEMGHSKMLLFCLSREFQNMFVASKGRDDGRPFTKWLLSLVKWVGSENPERKVGVIGMCLTGGFSLATIANPNVKAAVMCQPSFPVLSKIETLGLSDTERQNAREGAQKSPGTCVKSYRYAQDFMSREVHIKAARDILGSKFEAHPDLPGKGHSTLTRDTASEEVFRDVLGFLNSRI